MATRRPASSRARINNNTNPMPPPSQQQRPKSVMSRPPSSQRTGDEQDSTSAPGAPRIQRGQEDSETHIQVIIRCRGRSDREMQANSPSIVQIEGAKCRDLKIETTTPVSSLGVLTLPPTRTYPFDLVFGPEATQSMIYHDVVGPMLSEVMTGYNCTLFAYGQTGTGKTYTMQGDLYPTPMGNPSAHAGIIPRVLFRLFHELEKAHTDFVVKISFIELYNEELRDLLAIDLSAPTTLTQPMGKDAKGSEEKLKIFDDATKRGVFIQGLEEIAVKDSKDALALLMKGSERRQIAATKFNDHSSRSHSVFSITVHIKETNTMGDDLLKVGKLNLVDLAGSENIGRSGAENKRAREAGIINQSLLTLGRVINALVDKAQHVPYRESKLTRLLQDSLGGRTKTCIIATISPARANLEETLSTLDYALRAKSIRNKPELNQRMTRNSLLKEYVAEIERLKSDLLAAREKNGIYFSEETWNQMNAENELKETELVEAKKQVEIIENQMRSVRDEYDQSIAVLKRREEELQQTKRQLEETQKILGQREEELQQAKDAYQEEVLVRQAHQATEVVLDGVAADLKTVAAESLLGISGLFDKLERKNKVFLSNKRVVSENEKLIHSLADSLTKRLFEFDSSSSKIRTNLQDETTQFRSSQKDAMANHLQEVNDHFDKAQELFQQIETHQVVEDCALSTIKQEIEKAHKSLNQEVTSWAENLTTSCSQLCNKSTELAIAQINTLEDSTTVLHTLVETISREIHSYLDGERNALAEMQSLSKTASAQEIAHLQSQNKLLAQMVVNEKEDAEKAKNELLQRVSGLLGDFMHKRDDTLRASIGSLQRSNKEAEQLLTATYHQQSKVHGDMGLRNEEVAKQMEVVKDQGAREKNKTTQNVGQARELISTRITEIQSKVATSATGHSAWVHQQAQAMEKSTRDASEEQTKAKRARIESTDVIYARYEAHHSVQHQFLASASRQGEKHATQTLSWISEQAQSTKDYEEATAKNLESIQQAASNLAKKGVKDDVPTGSTPRKRKWQYRDEWSLTKGRAELLSDWKQQISPAIEDDNALAGPVTDSHGSSQNKFGFNHRRIESCESENAGSALHAPETDRRSEAMKVVAPLTEPLIDSRKKNNVLTTRASRRLR
ncbi:hypothetical protein GALMADRAFT_239701 [Galerina marginata CBS 339.88]|uniref:Kinesin motor domain-containing protein n=1 Tax=Galerina marginata (strain CBS 339.88) TaxID=685588 RepID=A0A067TRM7_GALM3|nr:hypothetical protein GALMADRAFT_239701 [Galerina marginata CBS 339.88]